MREGMLDIFDDYHFCDWFTNLKVREDRQTDRQIVIYRVFIKNYVFSQFTATHLLHKGEQFFCARDPKVQSLLSAGHFLYKQ